jgi:PAS domain S-box-containing protein
MEKHHSCINTRAIIEYFQEKNPKAIARLCSGLGEEIDRLPDPLEFLMEGNNWVSSEVVIRMFANAREITGDPDIAFKIGFDSASRRKLGYIQRIILFAYRNPRRSLKRAQKINDKFNRNKRLELVETSRDRAIIRLHWFPDVPASPDFCLFNKGIYTGIPTIWNLPPAILDESKCYFRGDDYCEYHLKWVKRYSLKDALLNLLVPWRALRYTIEELERDKELLRKKFDEVHMLNLQLQEKIQQLLKLQEALQESEARFRNLLEFVPGVAVQGFEVDGTVRYWNRASEELFGYRSEEAVGKNLAELIIPPELQIHYRHLLDLGTKAVSTGELLPAGEYLLKTRDGQRLPVHSIHTVVCLDGSEPLIFQLNVDLTERKRVEEELRHYRDHLEKLVEKRTAALRESEERFRAMFERAPVGIVLIGLDWEILETNQALTQMLGYGPDELCQRRLRDFLHPEERLRAWHLFEEMLQGTRDFYEREGRYRRKDGSWMWGQVHVSLVRDEQGRPLFAVGMIEDITLKKEAQDKISAYQERLRALASELSLTEERERRRLAADLHDHIGQILALAQIKLGAIRQETQSPEGVAAVNEIREYISQAIRYTRSLTYELGLPILYDLGLEAALEWLAEQLEQQHGLKIEVHRHHQPLPLREAARVLVFRVVRELLTNVIKHAQATQVDIYITQEGPFLQLAVVDDGVGFKAEALEEKGAQVAGYGLFSIRERLSSLGGYLKIDSSPGQGTRVSLTVPLESREATLP